MLYGAQCMYITHSVGDSLPSTLPCLLMRIGACSMPTSGGGHLPLPCGCVTESNHIIISLGVHIQEKEGVILKNGVFDVVECYEDFGERKICTN